MCAKVLLKYYFVDRVPNPNDANGYVNGYQFGHWAIQMQTSVDRITLMIFLKQLLWSEFFFSISQLSWFSVLTLRPQSPNVCPPNPYCPPLIERGKPLNHFSPSKVCGCHLIRFPCSPTYLCCISKSLMKHHQKLDSKADLSWFSYGLRKTWMFVDLLNEYTRQLCSLVSVE